jgi:two-component system chemotaxis response regulator CheY
MQLDNSMKVLVVDDFSTMRAVVTKLLVELGFSNIIEASDGEEAWQKLQSGDFNLVVCDWNMPKMTGIELLNKIKEDSQFQSIRFILITAEAKPHQIIEAAVAGVDAYIVKPFSAETLYEKIVKVFNSDLNVKPAGE